jgi:hypothetical protein
VLGLLTETTSRFDDVVVTGPDPTGEEPEEEEAPPKEEPKGGENGTNGQNGTNGSSGADGTNGTNGTSGADGTSGGGNTAGTEEGAGGVSAARLEGLTRSSLVGSATLHGTRLSVKAKCPAKAGAACTISLRGMLSRKKAATVGRRAKVKKAKTKSFALRLKPAARAKVRTKKRLMFKETIKVGGSTATVYKSLRLVRR